jgi:carboxyl-terminal processing protease
MKSIKDKKPTFELWEVLVITLVSSVIMGLSTGYVTYRSNKNYVNTENEYINELVESYNNITSNYYDNIDEKSLVDAAINGMLNYLGDPYTTYLDKTNTNSLTDALAGTYEGIGIEVSKNDNNEIEVKTVFDDTPSSEAGLLVGDVILKINEEDVTTKTTTDAVAIIKSSKSSDIKLQIKRNEEIKDIDVVRKELYLPVVSSELLNQNDKNIGYIAVEKFSETVFEQFSKELNKLEKNSLDGLIIDLRNNTGGFLVGATKMAELFLEKGKVIYSLQSKLDNEVTKDETDEKRDYKVYILVNKSSASASEILAAALKYSYGAKLVGTTTYGKGKVQKTSKLSDGTMYKYTSAKWLTPNGDCIDGIGLNPDLNVELSEEYANNMTKENDNQLQMALYEIVK